MKQKTLFLSIGLVFMLTACGGGDSNTNANSTQNDNTIINNSNSEEDLSITDKENIDTKEESQVTLKDNSEVALSMPNLNNDSSTPIEEIKK